MLFHRKAKEPFHQSETAAWKKQWQSLVPPECRDVPIEVDGKTVVAFVQINHFAMMLQDGLLMEPEFFRVCDHFRNAGYHIVWLMRCTQDVEEGYLHLKRRMDRGYTCTWDWKKPTTNFGRWTADNRSVTILLQTRELPDREDLTDCTSEVLQRVQWADSDDDNAQKIPGRTHFITVNDISTPKALGQWLHGELLGDV